MNANRSSRRDWLRSFAALGLSSLGTGGGATRAFPAERETVLNIGLKTQLFCDDFLIDSKDRVRHPLHLSLSKWGQSDTI